MNTTRPAVAVKRVAAWLNEHATREFWWHPVDCIAARCVRAQKHTRTPQTTCKQNTIFMPVKANLYRPTLHLNLFSFLSAVILAISEILCFGARESATCFSVRACVRARVRALCNLLWCVCVRVWA